MRIFRMLVLALAVAGMMVTEFVFPGHGAHAEATRPKRAKLLVSYVKVKTANTTTYIVKAGDCLWTIAQNLLGNGDRYMEIYNANQSVITSGDPALIYAGEVLTVDTSNVSPPPPPPPPPAAPVTSQDFTDVPAGSGLDNLITMAKFLVANGASMDAAAGVAADAEGESGGNPDSVGSGGCGLIGWTPCSVQVTGNDSADLTAQLQDLLAYINNNGSMSDLNAHSGSLTEAADWFSSQYERPAVLYSDVNIGTGESVLAAIGG